MMLTQGYIILGKNADGRKFRPSDWIARIASTYGQYDTRRRLCYNPNIIPVRYEEQNCLYVSADLADKNPAAYQHILYFTESNHLQVKRICKPDSPDTPEPHAEFPHAA